MGKVRGELEDLAFQHLEPDAYDEIGRAIRIPPSFERGSFSVRSRQNVESELRREGIPARIDGRVKRPFPFSKLRRQKISSSQVYDLMALRILTDSVKNCYAALGVIHNKWRPIPGRIKDFIADPQAESVPVAAHLRGGTRRSARSKCRSGPKRCTASLKRGLPRTGNTKKAERVRPLTISASPGCGTWWNGSGTCRTPRSSSTLKVDLYPEEVYTFTPRGKVLVLPRRYADRFRLRHSLRRRQHMRRPKVNGRIVPLRSSLRNGDIVDIMTQPGHEPSKDWLAFVKTARARNKIKHVINASERIKAVETRANILDKETRRLGVQLGKVAKSELEKVASEYGYSKNGGPVRRARLRKVFRAPGAGQGCARRSEEEPAEGSKPAG